MGRNYKTNPHTARWLMTFHTANGANYSAPASADAEDRSAMHFVSGSSQVRAAERIERMQQNTIEVSGWSVLTGPGLVSEKQAKWMISIAHRPSITDAMRESLKTRLFQGFARAAASQFIDKYKDTPTAARDAAMMEAIAPGASTEEFKAAQQVVKTRPEVKDGRYAVEHEGTLKFYRLKNGRKAGYVFLDVQASDDWHPIRNPRRIDEILALIVESGELNAARRYGIELGQCSRCGRTLTDETSRAYGIGPDCRNK